MAIMHPSQLPRNVLGNRQLKGEVDTYRALSRLTDEYEVFYNRSANGGQGSRAHKRRLDFIVLHETLGLLAIEVKGGKIRLGNDGSIEQFHPSKGAWVAIYPYGQVEKATISLIKECKSDGAAYWIPDDTCVVFAHTQRREISDVPNLLPSGTLCSDDLPVIQSQMPTLFSKSPSGRAWSRDAFIDMRRRLLNMPETKRPGAGFETGSDLEMSRSLISKGRQKIRQLGAQKSNPQPDETIIDNPRSRSETIDYSHATTWDDVYATHTNNVDKPKMRIQQRRSLALWQVSAAVLIGVGTAAAYVWLAPHTLLHSLH